MTFNPFAVSPVSQITLMNDEPSGTIARTVPRRMVTAGTLAIYNALGQVGVHGCPLPAGVTVNNIKVLIGNTAAVAPTNYWLALLDKTLRVLAVSADNGAGALAANTPVTLAMLAAYLVPVTDLYYVATSFAGTTAPTLAGSNAESSGVASTLGAPTLAGTAGTQVAPPAVGAQLNGGVIAGNGAFAFGAWLS